MPYNTKEKQKVYYYRHAKYYNQEFKKRNREKWNEYQKIQAQQRRKRLRDKKLFEDIVELIRDHEDREKRIKNYKWYQDERENK